MRYASLAIACALALLAVTTTLLAQPSAEPKFAARRRILLTSASPAAAELATADAFS